MSSLYTYIKAIRRPLEVRQCYFFARLYYTETIVRRSRGPLHLVLSTFTHFISEA